jgi:MoxR-like ATPase
LGRARLVAYPPSASQHGVIGVQSVLGLTPNDLLTVLDEPWEFSVPEADGQLVSAVHPPIVIITSNKEKGNLPAPFLRRCIYFFVEFPDSDEQLRAIIDLHYKLRGGKPPQEDLLRAATERFLALRRSGGLHKKPGTSEFLDWVEVLHNYDRQTRKAARVKSDPLLYPELLLKLRVDWQRRDMPA